MAKHESKDLARHMSPEELELQKKLAELAQLEIKLADRELELSTLAAELAAFEKQYMNVVGRRYAELDEIEARIAEINAKRNPGDTAAQEEATSKRRNADSSADAARDMDDHENYQRFQPSDQLKKLFRNVAKAVHPDLANNDEDRVRREKMMKEANDAYSAGDEDALQRILQDWNASPESVTGEGVAVELVRTIRKIAQVENRLREIDRQLEELKANDLYVLRSKVEEAGKDERDLLAMMAAQLDEQIEDMRGRVERLAAEID